MPQNIAVTYWLSTVLSGVGTLTTPILAVALNEQLNQTHTYLYLDLPIWVFFILTIILSMIGSYVAIWTDLMQDSQHKKFSTFFVGFFLGLIGAFIVLPTFTTKPSMPIMMITGLILSFCGTILVHNLSELLRSDDGKQAINQGFKDVFGLVFGRIKAAIKTLLGGDAS